MDDWQERARVRSAFLAVLEEMPPGSPADALFDALAARDHALDRSAILRAFWELRDLGEIVVEQAGSRVFCQRCRIVTASADPSRHVSDPFGLPFAAAMSYGTSYVLWSDDGVTRTRLLHLDRPTPNGSSQLTAHVEGSRVSWRYHGSADHAAEHVVLALLPVLETVIDAELPRIAAALRESAVPGLAGAIRLRAAVRLIAPASGRLSLDELELVASDPEERLDRVAVKLVSGLDRATLRVSLPGIARLLTDPIRSLVYALDAACREMIDDLHPISPFAAHAALDEVLNQRGLPGGGDRLRLGQH